MLLSDARKYILTREGLWIDPSTGELLYNGEEILPNFTFKECTEEMKPTVSKPESMPMNVIPQIKRLHFSGPCTAIIWDDDSKTLVRAMEDTSPNPYFGFCAAVTQKVFGSNCAVKRVIKQLSGVDVNREPAQAPVPEAETKTGGLICDDVYPISTSLPTLYSMEDVDNVLNILRNAIMDGAIE